MASKSSKKMKTVEEKSARVLHCRYAVFEDFPEFEEYFICQDWKSLVEIQEGHSEAVVKEFYQNLVKEGDVLKSTVRSHSVRVTEEALNGAAGCVEVCTDDLTHPSKEEKFNILIEPGKQGYLVRNLNDVARILFLFVTHTLCPKDTGRDYISAEEGDLLYSLFLKKKFSLIKFIMNRLLSVQSNLALPYGNIITNLARLQGVPVFEEELIPAKPTNESSVKRIISHQGSRKLKKKVVTEVIPVAEETPAAVTPAEVQTPTVITSAAEETTVRGTSPTEPVVETEQSAPTPAPVPSPVAEGPSIDIEVLSSLFQEVLTPVLHSLKSLEERLSAVEEKSSSLTEAVKGMSDSLHTIVEAVASQGTSLNQLAVNIDKNFSGLRAENGKMKEDAETSKEHLSSLIKVVKKWNDPPSLLLLLLFSGNRTDERGLGGMGKKPSPKQPR